MNDSVWRVMAFQDPNKISFDNIVGEDYEKIFDKLESWQIRVSWMSGSRDFVELKVLKNVDVWTLLTNKIA